MIVQRKESRYFIIYLEFYKFWDARNKQGKMEKLELKLWLNNSWDKIFQVDEKNPGRSENYSLPFFIIYIIIYDT